MIPTAYPEANRLSYRIRTALTGESTGLDTAKLAWQHAEATERANLSLRHACEALDGGSLLDAMLIENAHPNLLDAARALDYILYDEWLQRCKTYGWRQAEKVDLESAEKLENAIDEQGDLKEWLFKQYRTAVRAKDSLRAYQIIELIANRFPEDENAPKELATQRALVIEQAASEVKESAEQLIPSEPAKEIARRYLALGIPVESSSDPELLNAIAESKVQLHDSLAERVEALVEKAKHLSSESKWQEIESEHLACEYSLSVNEARGELEPQLRAELEQIGTKLTRIRSQHESNISIRLAIEEVRNGRVHKGKPVPLGNRVAKLRSLEAQATKTGSQVSPDLQSDIKAAYGFARRKRIPLIAAAAIVVLIIGLGSVFTFQKKQEQDAFTLEQDSALTALQAIESSGRTDSVRQALEKWEPSIAQAEPGSSLANQATLLREWLDMQTSLHDQYKESVEELGRITNSRDALANEEAIKVLAADIRRTRTDLAPDLGNETDTRFNTLLTNFEGVRTAAHEQDRQELDRLERELRIAATNATQSKTREEFERLQKAAEMRIVSIKNLLLSSSASPSKSQVEPLIESVEQELSATVTKWDALDNAMVRLAETKEIQPYIAQLERIQSFDILPATEKTAITQTLRLKEEFLELNKSQPLFSKEAATEFFGNETSYLNTSVDLSDEEKAFLTRLIDDETFSNVYLSTVQYFEGEADPQSEYEIYLVEPISKSDTQEGESDVTFSFSVKGYDESGAPEKVAREIQFISREDGSFWGFFYKPSKLSPESEYYQKTISRTLNHMLGGAKRLTLARLLEDLERQQNLAPAFRVYWQQQLLQFANLYPWKWGLALSPALQKRFSELNSLPGDEIGSTLWLSTIEQTVPSPEFGVLLARIYKELPSQEIEALASLYQAAANGSYLFAGHVLANGKADIEKGIRARTPLWTVNALTGSIDRLSKDTALTPFAPILHYSLSGGESAKSLLQKSSKSSGLKLNATPYKPLLPSLFQ